jgi:hypothetical protein
LPFSMAVLRGFRPGPGDIDTHGDHGNGDVIRVETGPRPLKRECMFDGF